MSDPVEGKPGVRLVWWCVEHDREARRDMGNYGLSAVTGVVRWCDKGWPEGCDVHRMELRQHGYERNIEWGEQ